MNARAGVVTSQVAWLLSLPVTAAAPTLSLSIKGALAGFVVSALASFLPDLDHPKSTVGRYFPDWVRRLLSGHRMGAHSLLAIIGSWWLCRFLVDDPIVARAMAVGWGSHVFCDMLTIQGVALLYPLVRHKFHVGRMVTGQRGEDRYVTGMKILAVVIIAAYLVLIIRNPEAPVWHSSRCASPATPCRT